VFAVEQHGRLVFLPFPDDDDALHGHRANELAHGVDRCTVRPDLVPTPHPAARGHGGGFGHPHKLEGEVAVGSLPPAGGDVCGL
jgi:hypothetical protein